MLIGAHLREAIQRSLDDIGATPTSQDHELPRRALTCIGDALRAGLSIPAALLRRIEATPASDVARAVQGCTSAISAWSETELGPREDALGSMLVERDTIESFRVGLRRWAIARKVTPFEVSGAAELASMLASFDRRLAAWVPRSAAESLLGDRAALLGTDPWTATLRKDDAGSEASEDAVAWDPAMASAEPSDQTLTDYIRDGAAAAYVEGFAARVARFGEALELLVEASSGDGDQVSLLARRWLRNRRAGDAARAPLVAAILPRQLLAAATAPEPLGSRSLQLGALGVAQGRIVATATTATLIVYAPVGTLREVRFGAIVTTAPEVSAGTEKWTATTSNLEGPLPLCIVHADGSIAFDELITLLEGEPRNDAG